MRLTPLGIKKQEFPKTMKGYTPESVSAFLEQVAAEFEELMKENEKLRDSLVNSESQLIEFKNIEKELRETLLKAQENSSKTYESTKRQASILIKEAELRAQQIMENHRSKEYELQNSIFTLQREKALLLAKLKSLVYGYARHLGVEVKTVSTQNTNTKMANIVSDVINNPDADFPYAIEPENSDYDN